mgnify:CR=1 FL=1
MTGMLDTIKNRLTPTWLLVGALVCIGALVRVVVNDVAAYSPADEAHYVDITRWLLRDGLTAYPKFVATYLERETMWLSPTPLRWGYFSLTTLACTVQTPCDGRAIAWLSTFAGVASLLLTYLLGRRLVGRSAALVATALSIFSPLQLALGRRALQDEVYCAAVLFAFWTFMRLFDPEEGGAIGAGSTKRWAGFVAASTLAFSIKEAFVFPYAAFVVLYLFGQTVHRVKLRDVAFFVAPPLLFCAGFVLLGRDASALYELARLNEASFASDYSIRYQSGPAHRPLFDLFLLAPIVCLWATSAVAKITERVREGGREKWLAGFLILTLAAFMGLPKNLRFVVILDPVLRLLGAWFVVNHAWFGRATREGKAALAAALVLLDAAIEYSLFETVFRQRNVYDPTTYDILRALGAIPGSFLPTTSTMWALVTLLAFGGAGTLVVGIWRAAMTDKEKETAGQESDSSKASQAARPPMLIAVGIAGLALAFAAGRWSARSDDAPPGAATPSSSAVVGTNPAVVAKPNRDPMVEGLDALYGQKDPAKAVTRFREVLAADPTHYGATYQLATALEQAGDKIAARATWAKMATMAENQRDEVTLTHARARLAALDPPPAPAVVDDPLAEPMRLGLAALYEKKDPAGAAKYFRDVLAKNPNHYGATFQLATALEQAGKKDEAKPYWTKSLEMAEAIKDTQTATIARKYLGKSTPQIFGGFQ